MTRQITEAAIRAFNNNENFSLSNTVVKADCTGTYLYLYSNLIARKVNNRLQVTLAGWNTNTTRERLNGLAGVCVTTKRGQAYINGKAIEDNAWVQIEES